MAQPRLEHLCDEELASLVQPDRPGLAPTFKTFSLLRTRLRSGWVGPGARAAPRQDKFSKGKTERAKETAPLPLHPAPQTPQSRGCQEKPPFRPPWPLLRRRRPEKRRVAGEPSDSEPTATLGRHLASVPLASRGQPGNYISQSA